MNREIKFRAWFKVQKRMVYNLGFDQFSFRTLEELEGTEYMPSVYDMDIVVDDENFELSYEGTFNFEIMQFTGLKDRNGVEIYEGDIVQCFQKGQTKKGMVAWSKGMWSWQFDKGADSWLFEAIYKWNGVVVGNIHEDKEASYIPEIGR